MARNSNSASATGLPAILTLLVLVAAAYTTLFTATAAGSLLDETQASGNIAMQRQVVHHQLHAGQNRQTAAMARAIEESDLAAILKQPSQHGGSGATGRRSLRGAGGPLVVDSVSGVTVDGVAYNSAAAATCNANIHLYAVATSTDTETSGATTLESYSSNTGPASSSVSQTAVAFALDAASSGDASATLSFSCSVSVSALGTSLIGILQQSQCKTVCPNGKNAGPKKCNPQQPDCNCLDVQRYVCGAAEPNTLVIITVNGNVDTVAKPDGTLVATTSLSATWRGTIVSGNDVATAVTAGTKAIGDTLVNTNAVNAAYSVSTTTTATNDGTTWAAGIDTSYAVSASINRAVPSALVGCMLHCPKKAKNVQAASSSQKLDLSGCQLVATTVCFDQP